ncbi:hypothetical protein [Flavivirga algicola]|uniref:Lipoprotein n=1 Tax=Flavivirga algicola TaxID=2729136 RepID=A0ABX1S513_9FLAO|nr:hypothetical protein [Flavivirga algicola]NMH89524.1 hypothetical protein [Flavivirga algicola]
MKHFFKALLITTLFLGTLLSCSSGEETSQKISDEKITSSLSDKMVETAISENDYSLINFNCIEGAIMAHFINNQGDYAAFTLTLGENIQEQLAVLRESTFSTTGIRFTNDDLFLDLLIDYSTVSGGILSGREDFIQYFEDCSFEGDKRHHNSEPLPLSGVNYNCSGDAHYVIIEGLFFDNIPLSDNPIPLSSGITAVEQALLEYNNTNNSNYTIDNVGVSLVDFTSPGGTASRAIWKSQLVNYFEDCTLDKGRSNDCINFKYPFVINKINLQTDEIIPVTITDDNELIINLDSAYVTIEYPITLVALNGDEIIVDSNEELETVLTNSETYCHDEW